MKAQHIEIERVESILFACRLALKLLHPVMDEEEPCVVYDAYSNAGELLCDLEDLSVAGMKLLEPCNGESDEASGLLEQAINTLEMIYNFGDDLVNKNELLFRAIKRVVKAQKLLEETMMAKKGVPKQDGSGGGTRKNQGRGGCATPKKTGKGRK